MVQAEASMRAIFVADKILPKKWVRRLVMLKVESPQFHQSSKRSARELLST